MAIAQIGEGERGWRRQGSGGYLRDSLSLSAGKPLTRDFLVITEYYQVRDCNAVEDLKRQSHSLSGLALTALESSDIMLLMYHTMANANSS